MSRPYRTREDERDVFRALAHPARRQILTACIDSPFSFDQMMQLVRRSKATVAEHLRILRDARLVTATRIGRTVTYQANRLAMRTSARWLADLALSERVTKSVDSSRSNAA